jgi:hypothetical protein
MIVGRIKPETYAFHLYQIEIEGSHFVSSQVMEGEIPPNSNVLFPVVFENEAYTPLSHVVPSGPRREGPGLNAGICRALVVFIARYTPDLRQA